MDGRYRPKWRTIRRGATNGPDRSRRPAPNWWRSAIPTLPRWRARLAALVGECTEPRCIVAGQCASAQRARQWLAEYEADIVLLDIQMPGQLGTALAAELGLQAPFWSATTRADFSLPRA